jgi:hypothetical protein
MPNAFPLISEERRPLVKGGRGDLAGEWSRRGNYLTDADRNRLELQCAAIDKQIDAAVYELGVYPAEGGRLTESATGGEIKIVEGK